MRTETIGRASGRQIAGTRLTAHSLRELVEYDPESGRIFWRVRRVDAFATENAAKTWNSRFAGQEAFLGVDCDGYRRGSIWGRSLRAHRVAWAWAHGAWPDGEIDHINGDPADNRIGNLRVVTDTENSRNQARNTRNKSGVTGVCWCAAAGKWQAQIWVDGGSRHLGRFDKFEDAVAVRKAAEHLHGFHANHGRQAHGGK